MPRLELLRFFEKAHNLVKVEEGLLYHLDDFIFVATELFHRLKQFGRHDVVICVLGVALFPELILAVRHVVKHLRVLMLPPVKAFLLSVCLAMHLKEREQLPHQSITGQFERGHRALKPLEKPRADKAHDLLLAVLLEGVDTLVISLVVSEWVVNRQSEQGVFPLKCLFQQIEQTTISLAD